jgi:hypothetical protein
VKTSVAGSCKVATGSPDRTISAEETKVSNTRTLFPSENQPLERRESNLKVDQVVDFGLSREPKPIASSNLAVISLAASPAHQERRFEPPLEPLLLPSNDYQLSTESSWMTLLEESLTDHTGMLNSADNTHSLFEPRPIELMVRPSYYCLE